MSDYYPPDDDDGDDGQYQAPRAWDDEPPQGDERVCVAHRGVVRETSRATLYRFIGDERWMPKSKTTNEGTRVVMPAWLAARNGLSILEASP